MLIVSSSRFLVTLPPDHGLLHPHQFTPYPYYCGVLKTPQNSVMDYYFNHRIISCIKNVEASDQRRPSEAMEQVKEVVTTN